MSYLTPTELRSHVSTGADDTALQRYLDAAEVDIITILGPTTGRTQRFGDRYYTGSRYIFLPTRAASITSITEQFGTILWTLSTNDWRLIDNGWTIERMPLGTNPRAAWTGEVFVTFETDSDLAVRKRVEVMLVKIDLAYNGLVSEGMGDVSSNFGDKPYAERRHEVLDSLYENTVVIA